MGYAGTKVPAFYFTLHKQQQPSAGLPATSIQTKTPEGRDSQPFKRVLSSSFVTFLLLCLANKEEEK